MNEPTSAAGAGWKAKLLTAPPAIAPARRFIFPVAVPGEEDALARGSVWVEVQPATGGTFLAQCAIGFTGAGVATGVWAAPHAGTLLAVAGGYAYAIPTAAPETTFFLPMRPVVRVLEVPAANALALVGFHAITVLSAEDEPWQSPRISWEGVTVSNVDGTQLNGTGWHMQSDTERPFTLDIATRELTGGGYTP